MRKPPDWIIKLPAGKYETKQLVTITGLNPTTIAEVLVRYGAEVKKVPAGYRNLQKNIFIWDGFKKVE